MFNTLSLAQITEVFNDEDKARELLENLRWKGEATCPHCESLRVYKLTPKEGSKTRKGLWKCGTCRKQFTVTVGTIFEQTRIPLGKWLMAIHKLCSSKKGISALQLMRELWPEDGYRREKDGYFVRNHYKTAFFMMHRIRYAMGQEPLRTKLKGTVEADEVYLGGKQTNMHHKDKVRRGISGRGTSKDKAPVITLVERGGNVKTHHMEHVTSANIKKVLRDCVAPNNAFLMTDEAMPYKGAKHMFLGHESVNHSQKEYVRGIAHVNTAESVHALLRRGVMGTYHHWSKKHLHRYLAEFDFRWNHRKITDGERTVEAIAMVAGKRLKYSDPIKK